jgi:glutamate N-acetyltransferase/amino-acid N-acetyltransferase
MKKLQLPTGFSAAGIAAGIKKNKKDMALIVSDFPAVSAAVFTTNQIKAAPVKHDIQILQHETARAIVINSGNANACTGPQGEADAKTMAEQTARQLDIRAEEVFVCSTGTIGKPLPMETVCAGITRLAEKRSSNGGLDAATAILTTDLVAKTVTTELDLDGARVRLTGIAKGSGMIEPNMATMLAFILTDAAIEKHTLQHALRLATDTTFNRISVDGDQSTNDSVIALANGSAGNTVLTQRSKNWKLFFQALEKLMFDLAMMIVKDGEGASRVVTVKVTGAASDGEADEAARAVANSMLNKTAWAGTRPNWGRIMDAIGYSFAQIQESRVDIRYDEVELVKNGHTHPDASLEAAVEVVSKDEFTIGINLNIGKGKAVIYTCNCTEDYVRINVE